MADLMGSLINPAARQQLSTSPHLRKATCWSPDPTSLPYRKDPDPAKTWDQVIMMYVASLTLQLIQQDLFTFVPYIYVPFMF